MDFKIRFVHVKKNFLFLYTTNEWRSGDGDGGDGGDGDGDDDDN